jgi:uncharacterized membrane protein
MIPRFVTVALATSLSLGVLAQDGKPHQEPKTPPAKTDKAEKVDFEKQIWPILEKRCIDCHSTPKAGPDGKMKKPKGGVVLDNKDGITASKKGKLVVAKHAADSMIVQSISLPADDEDRMPPAKKGDPLPQEQIDLIKAWIDQGANFGTWNGKAKDADGDKPKTDKPVEGTDKPKEKGRL